MKVNHSQAVFADPVDAVDFIAFLKTMSMEFTWHWHSSGALAVDYVWRSKLYVGAINERKQR